MVDLEESKWVISMVDLPPFRYKGEVFYLNDDYKSPLPFVEYRHSAFGTIKASKPTS